MKKLSSPRERLIKFRMRKVPAMRQRELAELIGVDQATLCRWETGKVVPQPPQAKLIQAVTGIPWTAWF